MNNNPNVLDRLAEGLRHPITAAKKEPAKCTILILLALLVILVGITLIKYSGVILGALGLILIMLVLGQDDRSTANPPLYSLNDSHENAVGFALSQLDRHGLPGKEISEYCGTNHYYRSEQISSISVNYYLFLPPSMADKFAGYSEEKLTYFAQKGVFTGFDGPTDFQVSRMYLEETYDEEYQLAIQLTIGAQNSLLNPSDVFNRMDDDF